MALALEKFLKLLHPAGASPYLAAIIGVAGFEIGLNTPYTVAEVLAFRSLMIEGVEPFMSAMKSVPEPSSAAFASSVMLAILCLFTLGGWINVSFALQRSEEPSTDVWHRGIRQSGRALFWLGFVGTLVILGVLGVGGVAAGVIKAWLMGYLGTGWSALALPIGASSALVLTVAGGMYVVATSYLMGVVAIVEPATRFRQIPKRSREIFQAADGWRFFWKMAPLLFGWFLVKLSLLQLIIPFQPVSGLTSRLISVFGAIVNSSLTLGDGLVVLLGIWWAVQSYVEGLEKLQQSLFQASARQIEEPPA